MLEEGEVPMLQFLRGDEVQDEDEGEVEDSGEVREDEGEVGATTSTSPSRHCSAATWIIQLSAGGI